jgi:hypothetical protein
MLAIINEEYVKITFDIELTIAQKEGEFDYKEVLNFLTSLESIH